MWLRAVAEGRVGHRLLGGVWCSSGPERMGLQLGGLPPDVPQALPVARAVGEKWFPMGAAASLFNSRA